MIETFLQFIGFYWRSGAWLILSLLILAPIAFNFYYERFVLTSRPKMRRSSSRIKR